MENIIIIGAGGFGRELKCILEDINSVSIKKKYNILGFVDDGIKTDTIIHGLKVLGGTGYLKNLKVKPSLVFGLGDPGLKKKLFYKLKEFKFPIIIHHSVSLNGYNIKLGKGCVICQGTVLTCDIVVSDFVTINLSCTIGHDVFIGKYSSLMPSVNVSGEVTIEDNVFIGTGVKIINKMQIGAFTIVGAGAVVSKDLPKNCTAVGIPAKPIKFH